jgi:acetyl/propionyl-CoA carboxylase alpha subunit
MFDKILIANRGDQLRSGAATQSHRLACVACSGDFTAETTHV